MLHEISNSIEIAGIRLNFVHIDDDLVLEQQKGSRFFFPLGDAATSIYNVKMYKHLLTGVCNSRLLLRGDGWDGVEQPYSWTICIEEECIVVRLTNKDVGGINCIAARIDKKQQEIDFFVDSNNAVQRIDFFEGPIGILLYIYLVHFAGGFVLHASGVNDYGNGYLFSGVSGIGKSTMAKIWMQNGATIVNDDRLLILPVLQGFEMFNTPMPYYIDEPKKCTVKALFFLNQAGKNYCRQVSQSQGLVRLMANCMQHLHTKEFVNAHLDILHRFSQSIPIYDLGFKPDKDIVELIRGEMGHGI